MKITPNQFAWIFLVVLISLIGWGGFTLYDYLKNHSEALISVEQEVKLGEMLDPHSSESSDSELIVSDPFADSCIAAIRQKLLTALGSSNYDYRFRLIENAEPNAYALPGARIYIHTGLVEFCNSPEELIAVLAHEMGHTEHRHGIDRMIQQVGMDALLVYLTDGNSGTLEQFSGQMMANYFSREDESEADDFALNLLEKAGIRPAVLGEVFTRMKQNNGDGNGNGIWNLLSTHPELDQRSEKAAAYITQSGFNEVKIEMDWNRLQKSVTRHQ